MRLNLLTARLIPFLFAQIKTSVADILVESHFSITNTKISTYAWLL